MMTSEKEKNFILSEEEKNEKLLFCGNSDKFLKPELTKMSNISNGGVAFRIPSLINANGTLIAAIDRQSCGSDWGYIELAVRYSQDGGKTWSDVMPIAKPPARETRISGDCYASAFYIDACMALAPNGDVILIADFYPECKGLHKKNLLDKKKMPYALLNNKIQPLIYDRDGNFYYIDDNGDVINSKKEKTAYKVKGVGKLYENDKYVGNIHLNGKAGQNEVNKEITFGAPLKTPKRSYVYMFKSSDCGKTWSEPKDITSMILNKNDGVTLLVAPGVGITTKDGRIIMPLYVDRKMNVAIYSDDNGETWHRTASAPYAQNIDEWQMIEAKDGTVIGLGRQMKYGKTPMSISTNGGKTWIKLKKTSLFAPKCQKSVISKDDYVFCSHPSERKRENGVLSVGKIRYSKGCAASIDWIADFEINKGFFAYSCLTFVDDNTIGIMYEDEPSSHIMYKTMNINDLIDNL